MKRPTTLLYRALQDEGLQVGCAVVRDYKEICNRFKHEGMSFLTITLPRLSDILLQGLSGIRLSPHMFHGFKPCKRGGRLPALMSGFFRRVFNEDGTLLDHPCIDAIASIHKISRFFKKVELPCSAARITRAYERYVSNDARVSEHGYRCPTNPDLWSWVTGHLWSDLEDISGNLYCFPGIFGSGATAERAAFNERHSIKQWPARSETSFPSSYHATSSPERGNTDELTFVHEEDELPVRVVQVPKTLKTPRTISVEPSYMMLMQQSIAKPLMAYIESERFPYKSIRFTDQSVNREMARIGSIDGGLSTIDLSDASDLVSNDLVKNIFQCCPTFLNLIQDCRSTRAELPDSSTINLAKFASQGSALCFPIEAMTFFTIVIYSVLRQTGRRPSKGRLADITANISVYGDDIVVPTEMAAGVMVDLESFGLKVNHEKSFSTGFFRESCGGDYYKGVDITPTYCRLFDFTGKSRKPRIVATYVSLSNQLYLKGQWNASQYVREHLSNLLGRRSVPTAKEPIGTLHYVSLFKSSGLRWDTNRCGYSVRGPVLLPRRKRDRISDYTGALKRAFMQREHARGISLFRSGILSRAWGSQSGFSHDYNPIIDHETPKTLSVYPFLGRHFEFDESVAQPEQGVREYSSIQADALVRYFNLQSKEYLKGIRNDEEIDFDTSIKSYSLKLKNRWTPTFVGLTF